MPQRSHVVHSVQLSFFYADLQGDFSNKIGALSQVHSA